MYKFKEAREDLEYNLVWVLRRKHLKSMSPLKTAVNKKARDIPLTQSIKSKLWDEILKMTFHSLKFFL